MRGYIITGVLLAAFLFFTLQQGHGPLVVLSLPFVLASVVYHGVRMLCRAHERKSHGLRVVAWCAAVIVSAAAHLSWGRTNRSAADSVALSVLEYQRRTGSYPASLAQAGLGERPPSASTRPRYAVRDGRPALTYPATFMPLTTHTYDFEARRWRRNAD